MCNYKHIRRCRPGELVGLKDFAAFQFAADDVTHPTVPTYIPHHPLRHQNVTANSVMCSDICHRSISLLKHSDSRKSWKHGNRDFRQMP